MGGGGVSAREGVQECITDWLQASGAVAAPKLDNLVSVQRAHLAEAIAPFQEHLLGLL